MNYFNDENVNLEALKKKAFNLRWAEVPDNIIPMTAADPDYPCAPEIRKAMSDYISDGYFSYTPKLGLDEFKVAFCNYARKKGEEIKPELVLPVDSAARAMNIIAKAFLRPGDEMIVFDPCDFLFREACLSAGATPVSYPVALDELNCKMDLSHLEEYITPRTRVIGLCNPHNPFGLVYSIEELDYLMSLCEKYDLYIMNDEIWSDIVYSDAKFNSIYCLGNKCCDRVLSVFGYSKSFGLAGLRIGNIYATNEDNFNRLVQASEVLSTVGGATSLSQVAARAAMNDAGYYLADFLKHLEENRDYAVEYINKLPLLHAYKPQATYLLYVDIRETGMSGKEFVDYLADNYGVSLVPGGHQFFGDMSEGHIRICFATSKAILNEGLDRLRKGMEALSNKGE